MRNRYWAGALVAALMLQSALADDSFCGEHPVGMRMLVCNTPSRLAVVTDEELALRRLLDTSAEPPSAIRARDSRWREGVLARCRDANCVAIAYRHHVARLHAQVWQRLGRAIGEDRIATSRPLDNANADRICRLAASIANRGGWRALVVPGNDVAGRIPGSDTEPRAWRFADSERDTLSRLTGHELDRAETLYRLPLRAGAAPARFVEFQTSGTCGSTSIRNLDRLLETPAGQDVDDGRVAAVDENGNTGSGGEFFGSDERVIWIDRRYFLLTTWLDHTVRLTWMARDGRLLPTCELSVTKVDRVLVAGASLPVCKAISNGSARPLAWADLLTGDPSSPDHADRAMALFGYVPEGAELLRVDLDGSGHPRDLVRTWFGGAGCGQPRYQLGERDSTDHLVPLPARWLPNVDALSPLDVYEFAGIDYFAVDADGRRILAFGAGKARTVCDLEPRYKWDVSARYDLERDPGHRLTGPSSMRPDAHAAPASQAR